jgi:hypothetical protein
MRTGGIIRILWSNSRYYPDTSHVHRQVDLGQRPLSFSMRVNRDRRSYSSGSMDFNLSTNYHPHPRFHYRDVSLIFQYRYMKAHHNDNLGLGHVSIRA